MKRSVVAVKARAGGMCESCGWPISGSGVVHHRQLRSQGGSDDPANLLHLHDACHRWAHEHPTWAYQRGLIVRSWDDPMSVPVLVGAV